MSIRLLLTATIDVGRDMPEVARRDADTRRADYAAALARWMARPDAPGITFCENSGADLGSLEALAKGRDVEFLSYAAPAEDAPRGKGYGEMGLLMAAFARSAHLGGAQHVLKVTGRQFVPTIDAWLAALAARPELAVMCNLNGGLRFADSRAFAGTPAFYHDFLFPRCEQVDETKEVWFEHILALAVHAAMAEGALWSLPPVIPEFVGVSATYNVLNPDERNKLRRLVARARFQIKRKAY